MKFKYTYGTDVSSDYRGVTTSIERITPEVAAEMLKCNVNNRAVKREPIESALKDGQWRLNGATIVFAGDGTLLDGQHRLMACVASGVPFDTIVVRGLAHSSQVTMDSGVKRSVADHLRMRGYSRWTDVASIGSALLRADQIGVERAFDAGNWLKSTTTTSIVDFIEQSYAERIEPVLRESTNLAKRYAGLSGATVAIILDRLLGLGADRDDVDSFVAMLSGREVPTKTVLLLISRLRSNASDRTSRLKQRTLAALFVKAWNAYVNGYEVGKLVFKPGGSHPEAFPQLVVPTE